MLYIENNGAEIRSTNYWQTEWARRGLIYVSVNARAIRVLLPDQLAGAVREMATAQFVQIERRGRRIYLWFDDGSATPYRLDLDVRQFVPLPSPSDAGRADLVCTVWVQGDDAPEKVLSLPARVAP